MVISSPLALPIINLAMASGNLPIVANGLPLVPIGNDTWDATNQIIMSSI